MENASKALLMAAGILIGVLVLSLLAYLLVSFSQLYADIDRQNADQKLAQFNTQYTTYLHREDLTIYDVLTIVSYARENNNNYRDENGAVYVGSEDKIISVSLNTKENVQEESQSFFDDIIKDDQATIAEGNLSLPLYTCKSITYNSEGRVKSVKIQKN